MSRLTFKHLRSRYVCHDLNSKIVKSICRALALIPIVMVLKLSLKDQILINFTKPNSYFSYVSDHCL